MAHFKISLAGQLHFAPHAGDWGSLFVLFFVLGDPCRIPCPTPTIFPILHPLNNISSDTLNSKNQGADGHIQCVYSSERTHWVHLHLPIIPPQRELTYDIS